RLARIQTFSHVRDGSGQILLRDLRSFVAILICHSTTPLDRPKHTHPTLRAVCAASRQTLCGGTLSRPCRVQRALMPLPRPRRVAKASSRPPSPERCYGSHVDRTSGPRRAAPYGGSCHSKVSREARGRSGRLLWERGLP